MGSIEQTRPEDVQHLRAQIAGLTAWLHAVDGPLPEELRGELEALRSALQRISVSTDLETSKGSINPLFDNAEDRLIDFIESTNDGFYALDRDWRIIYANGRIGALLGRDEKEMIGKNFWEIFPKFLDTAVEQHLRRAMEERVPVHFQTKGFYSSGWYEDSAYPTRDGISMFLSDKTEEYRAIQALKDGEERLRIAQEAAEMGVWDWDLATNQMIWSPRMRAFYGFSFNEPVSMEMSIARIHPEDQERMIQVIQQATEQHRDFHYTYRVLHPQEGLRWIDSYGRVLYDELGTPNRVIGINLDVTERKTAEEALAEASNRLQTMIDHLPLGLVLTDREGHLIIVNPEARRLFVQQPGETVRPFDKFVPLHPDGTAFQIDELPLVRALKKGAVSQGLEMHIDLEGRGETILLVDSSPVLAADGSITGSVSAIQDVTEQRRLEAERLETVTRMEVQRRLMENREQERQEIARDIHDGPIQNLVSTIFNIQLVKEAFTDPALQLELHQIGLSVKGAVRELREVINELRPPSLIRFGLAKAIQMHAEDFRERYPTVTLHLELNEEDNRLGEAARLSLFRIYQEALNNVARHSGAANAWVQFDLRDQSAVLEVRDDGKGFQAPGDLTLQTRAGHFGVAGMRERSEAIGGTLTVVSAPGQGATIRVSVPLHE